MVTTALIECADECFGKFAIFLLFRHLLAHLTCLLCWWSEVTFEASRCNKGACRYVLEL